MEWFFPHASNINSLTCYTVIQLRSVNQKVNVAEGSISGVLEGRKYNREIRLLKSMYEALLRLAWSGFSDWLEEHQSQDICDHTNAQNILKNFHDNVTSEGYTIALQDRSVCLIIQRFCEYLDYLQISAG